MLLFAASDSLPELELVMADDVIVWGVGDLEQWTFMCLRSDDGCV